MGRGIRLTHEELNRIDLMRLKTTSTDVFRKLLDYHDVALRRHNRKHCRAAGPFSRDRYPNSAGIPRTRTRCPQAAKTAGKTEPGDTGIHFGNEA
jgi:hypothetical protein